MEEDTVTKFSKHPSIMVLSASLFRGFLFSILIGPLIWNIVSGASYTTVKELINCWSNSCSEKCCTDQ